MRLPQRTYVFDYLLRVSKNNNWHISTHDLLTDEDILLLVTVSGAFAETVAVQVNRNAALDK